MRTVNKSNLPVGATLFGGLKFLIYGLELKTPYLSDGVASKNQP